MKCHTAPQPQTDAMRSDRSHDDRSPRPLRHGFLWRWFWANSLVSGVFALAWLLLRSGTKPSRFVYPCQQAAISAATLAFGAPVVATLLAMRHGIVKALRSPVTGSLAALGLLLTAGAWGYLSRAQADTLELDPPPDYQAQVFHVTDCPPSPIGDRFVGLDNLISLMGREGLKFYQSAVTSPVAGPDGIVASDDVIVIKINYQWPQRGGSNTDVLKGLIHRIVNHPDTFVGEVVVCENAQFNSIDGFDRTQNNAQNPSQSPHDVVAHFQSLGFNVSHYDWTVRRNLSVSEYDTGNMTDGYIVYPYDSQLGGRISYPKFRSDSGTYISLKYGLWDPAGSSYDRARLKFINLPVLKSHHATYGVTGCVKHYMGVVTGNLGTYSHNAIGNGILGALLGEIQLADLNVLDAIWINANPYDGPWTTYSGATRRDQLVAGIDPVAIDIWATVNILIPAFIENGYAPPWPYPSADPDNPNSRFRDYLDDSMDYILAAGYSVTNVLHDINAFTWNGAGDFDGDSDIDSEDATVFAQCYTGPGGQPDAGCEAGDFDGDGDIDCADWDQFLIAWTDLGDPPGFDTCDFQQPLAAAVGTRYLDVTVPDSPDPVALLVSGDMANPEVSCLSQYVQADGSLGTDPLFQPPADWAAVDVRGAAILPETEYHIQVDYGTPGSPILSQPTSAMTWRWGDVNQDEAVTFTDIQLVVFGFQGDFSNAAMQALDFFPCAPNGVVNFEDILQDVLAFQGGSFSATGCAPPCP